MVLVERPSVHAVRMVKVLEIVWNFLNPFNVQGKLKKTFITILITHANFLLGIFSYVYTIGFANLSPSEICDNVAVLLQITRHFVYMTMLFLLRSRIQAIVDKIMKEREQLRTTDEDWSLSIDWMKKEFRVTLASIVAVFIQNFLLSSGSLFIKDANKHRMPYNFMMVYLPFGPFMTPKWIFQFVLQFTMANAAVGYYYFYSLYTLMVMNYSCWEIDALRSQVKRMFQEKEMDENLVDEQVKKVILRSYRVMDFLNEARALFRVSFLIDFSLSSFILCMCFYVLSADIFGSISIFVIVCLLFSQIAVFCWMGNRVNVCVENLYAAVYEVEWYTQKARHRSDLLLILIMAQRIKGFNGIFNTVDLETLLKILQFTYSLLALLQTTN